MDFTVRENVSLNQNLSLLKLHPHAELDKNIIKAGQFVNLLPHSNAETILRRPFSICNIDDNGDLWLMVKNLGRASSQVYKAEVGDVFNILLPLGNGFPIKDCEKPLLIGGGVGIAPLYYLGKKLVERGITPNFILGGRCSEDIPLVAEFEKLGNLHIVTENGSIGEKGLVTNHSAFLDKYDMIYCCGPLPMMKAVAEQAESRDIECHVSLENKMACGLGACLCCVEDTINGNECVCTSGPVFNTKDLKW
jgi:dihydroorotate dehydrogenase electron transfer subunit